MAITERILGFIGGGAMAEAIIKGLCSRYGEGIAKNIIIAEPNAERRILLQSMGFQVSDDNLQVVSKADGIILAVKPQVMEAVCNQIVPKLKHTQWFASIAAGVTLEKLESWLGNVPLVRIMPNTPALIGKGISALSAGRYCPENVINIVEEILQAVGETVIMDEAHIDAVTGLSGSGPAYVYLFIEALIDAGVKVGLPRDVSRKLALATVAGSTELLANSKNHPAVERDRVTSPGGTTITALQALEAKGFRTAVMVAVEAATNRSKDLGK